MVAASTLITDYMSFGTHAARPASPNVPAGGTAIYYETDTTNSFAWSGAAWAQLNGGGGGFTGPSIVQSGINIGTGISGVTLGAAPTLGSLLVAFAVISGLPSANTNWKTGFLDDGGGINFIRIYYKIAAAGESATQTPLGSTSNGSITIFELGNSVLSPPVYKDGGGAVTQTLNADAFGSGGLLIGICVNEASANLPTSLVGATAGTTATGASSSVEIFTKSGGLTRGFAANAITPTYAAATNIKICSMFIGASG